MSCTNMVEITQNTWSRGVSRPLRLRLLLVAVAILLILVLVEPSSARRNRGLRRKHKSSGHGAGGAQPSEAGATDPATPAPSHVTSEREPRRSRRRNRQKNKQIILKTSAKAKIITEKKYLKRDWCKSQPVRQHIRTASGCKGELINQFCYGQCNSFYIPKDVEVDDSSEQIEPDYFRSCAFCKPKTEEWISVRLRCRRRGRKKHPRFITKQVKRVKGCTCIAVPDLELIRTIAPTTVGGGPVNSTTSPETR